MRRTPALWSLALLIATALSAARPPSPRPRPPARKPAGERRAPLDREARPGDNPFRQRRAATLRLVSDAPRPIGALDRDAVDALSRDGLVAIVDGLVALPS